MTLGMWTTTRSLTHASYIASLTMVGEALHTLQHTSVVRGVVCAHVGT